MKKRKNPRSYKMYNLKRRIFYVSLAYVNINHKIVIHILVIHKFMIYIKKCGVI